MQPKKISIVTY